MSIDDINYFKKLYDIYSKYCSDSLRKYNLNLDNFKILGAIVENDKTTREMLLGKDKSNKLLKDIIDIYGEKAYKILGCNQYLFEISDIDGILTGENNQKYQEFYIRVLKQKY